MADRYFGFTCDPVRVADFESPLVLVRIEGCFSTRFQQERAHREARINDSNRAARMPKLPAIRYKVPADASYSFGIVALRSEAAQVCLDLLRRGVKPWTDPRRWRAA